MFRMGSTRPLKSILKALVCCMCNEYGKKEHVKSSYIYKKCDLTKTWYDFPDTVLATSTLATVERRSFTEPKLLHSWFWIYFKIQAWWLEDFNGCCSTSSEKTEQQADEGNWPWAHEHVLSLRLFLHIFASFLFDKKCSVLKLLLMYLQRRTIVYQSLFTVQSLPKFMLLIYWANDLSNTATLVLHHKQPPLQSAVVCKSDPVSCLTSHMTLQHLGCCCSRKTFYWKFDVCVVEVKRKAQTPQDTRASSALDVLNLHGWSWRLSGCLKSYFYVFLPIFCSVEVAQSRSSALKLITTKKPKNKTMFFVFKGLLWPFPSPPHL